MFILSIISALTLLLFLSIYIFHYKISQQLKKIRLEIAPILSKQNIFTLEKSVKESIYQQKIRIADLKRLEKLSFFLSINHKSIPIFFEKKALRIAANIDKLLSYFSHRSIWKKSAAWYIIDHPIHAWKIEDESTIAHYKSCVTEVADLLFEIKKDFEFLALSEDKVESNKDKTVA